MLDQVEQCGRISVNSSSSAIGIGMDRLGLVLEFLWHAVIGSSKKNHTAGSGGLLCFPTRAFVAYLGTLMV